MQFITPPGERETLVAAGVFVDVRGGVGGTEEWTIHHRGDGLRITRAELANAADGSRLLVEAVERANEAGSSNWQILFDWSGSHEGAISRCRASYLITPDSVFVERVRADRAPEYEDHPRPTGMLVWPLMQISLGALMRPLMTGPAAGPQLVVVPSLEVSGDGEQLLRPRVECWRSNLVEVVTLPAAAPGGPERDGLRFRYTREIDMDTDDNYNTPGEVWVDEHGIPQRHRWPSRAGEVSESVLKT